MRNKCYSATHQFLAVKALCGLLGCVYEERVGNILPALEGAVDPEGPSTPDVIGPWMNGRV